MHYTHTWSIWCVASTQEKPSVLPYPSPQPSQPPSLPTHHYASVTTTMNTKHHRKKHTRHTTCIHQHQATQEHITNPDNTMTWKRKLLLTQYRITHHWQNTIKWLNGKMRGATTNNGLEGHTHIKHNTQQQHTMAHMDTNKTNNKHNPTWSRHRKLIRFVNIDHVTRHKTHKILANPIGACARAMHVH